MISVLVAGIVALSFDWIPASYSQAKHDNANRCKRGQSAVEAVPLLIQQARRLRASVVSVCWRHNNDECAASFCHERME